MKAWACNLNGITLRVILVDGYIINHVSTHQFPSCADDGMLNWKMKSWTVTRAIMWLLCEHGRSKQSLSFIAHFVNLSNTVMAMPWTNVNFKTSMSQSLSRRVDMGCQAMNLRLRANYLFKISCIHACLQNVQHIKSPSTREKPPRVWVRSTPRQERSSSLSKSTKQFQ